MDESEIKTFRFGRSPEILNPEIKVSTLYGRILWNPKSFVVYMRFFKESGYFSACFFVLLPIVFTLLKNSLTVEEVNIMWLSTSRALCKYQFTEPLPAHILGFRNNHTRPF